SASPPCSGKTAASGRLFFIRTFTVPAFRLLFQESRSGEQRFSEALGQNLLLRFVSRRFCLVATAAKSTESLPVCGKMPVFPARWRIAFLQGGGACLIWAQSSLMMSA
ncbi:MAG: hypothetical protein LIO47_04925, partial [Akkermansia sp.]|nr:hypothetical protein [Akkermansia sp.]